MGRTVGEGFTVKRKKTSVRAFGMETGGEGGGKERGEGKTGRGKDRTYTKNCR